MTDKQLSLLKKYLSDDYVEVLVDNNKYSDFIGLILILKQPNRWRHWLVDRIELSEYNTEKYYEILIDLEIFDIFSFIEFIAE